MPNDKNDVVIIELDRPRELRYGHKAMKKLLALTGMTMEQLEAEDGIDLEQVEKYLYCGLLSDARDNNETLTLEQMEDLLDLAPSFNYNLEKMTEALNKAFGSLQEGNLPAPIAPAAQIKRKKN